MNETPDAARAAFEEALRLYPPAWVITRRALEDDVLGGVPVLYGVQDLILHGDGSALGAAIAGMADRVIHLGDGRVQRIERNEHRLSPSELSW